MATKTNNKNTIIFVEPLTFNVTLPDDFIEKYDYHKILLVNLNQGHEYRKELYDEIIVCDLRTRQGIEEVSRKISTELNICAIVGFSENSVIPAAILSEIFGVQGIGLETAKKCRNKYLMAESFRSKRVNAPKYFITNTSSNISEKITQIGGYPVICKPLMGYASNNVIRANNADEISKAIHKIKISNKFVMNGLYKFEESNYISTALIQEYIPGDEVAVDGYVENKVVKILSVLDKPDVSNGPYFPDKTHILPSKLGENILTKIEIEVCKCIDALNLNNSPFHVEARVHNGSIYIIELGARVGFPSCLYYATGINIFNLILDQKLERQINSINKWNRYAGNFCISSHKLGKFASLQNVDLVRRDPVIVDIPIFAAKGQRVAPYPHSNSYIGFVLACGSGYDEVLKTLYQAKEKLVVNID
jgi:biotin carboxylase